MDLLGHLALGFSVALTPVNLLYALIGTLLGTLIGVLPGIGPVATIAMLLPTTYALQPVSALIMLLGIVGTDVNSGVARFDFGIPELSDGIGVVVVAMGLFGFAEIILNLESTETREIIKTKLRGMWLSKVQFKQAFPAVLRGTALGSMLGVLPGGGAM